MKRVAWYIAAWTPLIAVLWLALFVTSSGRMPLGVAFGVAVSNAMLPMGAGVVVWHLTGRMPAPDRRPVLFAAIHTAAAIAFTALWTWWEWLQIGFGLRSGALEERLANVAIAWQSVIGLVVYGVVAGVCYGIRQWKRASELSIAVERAERLRAEAELASLRAHLNPHFLFNALHSVMALLHADVKDAERAIERLADLFQYVLRLDREHVEVVPLEDEWQFTQSYLWLEQLRMGDRLRVDAEMDDEVGACLIPPFTLQPLVENAIRHGLAPRREGGELRIIAHEREGRVLLEVHDNGVGASPELSDSGIGVRAVRQRLVARFGREAATQIVTTPGEGFRIRLSFPAQVVAAPIVGAGVS